jgi:hypothetical protein
MTAVVIGDSDDAGAAAVVRAMAASSAAATLVHPEQLSLANWEHAISPAGRVATRIELRDGRRLADDEIAAVLCRSFSLPAPRFARSGQADRAYAGAELCPGRAGCTDWDRVVNAVGGVSMTGPSWSAGAIRGAADRAAVAATLTATSGRCRLHRVPYAGGILTEITVLTRPR